MNVYKAEFKGLQSSFTPMHVVANSIPQAIEITEQYLAKGHDPIASVTLVCEDVKTARLAARDPVTDYLYANGVVTIHGPMISVAHIRKAVMSLRSRNIKPFEDDLFKGYAPLSVIDNLTNDQLGSGYNTIFAGVKFELRPDGSPVVVFGQEPKLVPMVAGAIQPMDPAKI